MNKRYISGIVITENVCETIAMEAPVSVSPPYAAGNTMELSPIGVAKHTRVKIIISSLAPKSFSTAIKIDGITIRRKRVVKYTLPLVNIF